MYIEMQILIFLTDCFMQCTTVLSIVEQVEKHVLIIMNCASCVND